MNETISSLLGPVAAMTALRPGLKARQVTTHAHEQMRIGAQTHFKGVGHWDFKPIPAQGAGGKKGTATFFHCCPK